VVQLGFDFKGGDPFDHGGQNRCLVAGAGADFQNMIAAFKIQTFGHESDDVRLRNGLAFADGQRVVLVGVGTLARRHEAVAGYPLHGLDDGGVGYAPFDDLLRHHFFARRTICIILPAFPAGRKRSRFPQDRRQRPADNEDNRLQNAEWKRIKARGFVQGHFFLYVRKTVLHAGLGTKIYMKPHFFLATGW